MGACASTVPSHLFGQCGAHGLGGRFKRGRHHYEQQLLGVGEGEGQQVQGAVGAHEHKATHEGRRHVIGMVTADCRLGLQASKDELRAGERGAKQTIDLEGRWGGRGGVVGEEGVG